MLYYTVEMVSVLSGQVPICRVVKTETRTKID